MRYQSDKKLFLICTSMKKDQFIPFIHSSHTVTPIDRFIIPTFDNVHPKYFQSSLNFHKFVPAYKKPLNSICTFLRYCLSRKQIGHTHILTLPNKKISQKLLAFVNLYQHAKKRLFH